MIQSHKTAYGISDKLAEYYWLIGILCGITEYSILAIIKTMPWYGYIFLIIPTIFCVWMAPMAIILPIYLLELFVWGVFHPKKVYKNVLKFIGIALVIVLSGLIAAHVPRMVASNFASADYVFWENCYISESPNATKFHYSPSCRYLRLSEYEVEVYDIYEAEDMGFEPCKSCLKQSAKYQYDVFAPFLFIPVTIFMFWLIFRVANISTKYKLRNPIVKR